MTRSVVRTAALHVVLLAASGALAPVPSLAAQARPTPSDGPASTLPGPTADPAPRPVVGILGASLSRGFTCPWRNEGDLPNRTVPLQVALDGVWSTDTVRYVDKSDQFTFLDVGKQEDYVARVREAEPDLVLGVDFLFWFGYGWAPRGDRSLAHRLAKQRRGFRLLDSFDADTPILVGDYPDMNGADNRMIPQSAIPSAEEITALNASLRRWAGQRANVRVFPLSKWVAETKAKGRRVRIGAGLLDEEGGELVLGARALFQSDRLHPLRLAMALVVDELADEVAPFFPGRHPLRTDPDLIDLIEHCRADGDLDEALELGYGSYRRGESVGAAGTRPSSGPVTSRPASGPSDRRQARPEKGR